MWPTYRELDAYRACNVVSAKHETCVVYGPAQGHAVGVVLPRSYREREYARRVAGEAMTVADLIALLSKLPPETKVVAEWEEQLKPFGSDAVRAEAVGGRDFAILNVD